MTFSPEMESTIDFDEWHKEKSERLEKELAEMTENVFAEEKETDYIPTVESDIFDSLRKNDVR